MSIQFHCPACGQPIEVDDDAANLPVTCPHCRRVSNAPTATEPNFDPRPRSAPTGSARPISTQNLGGYQNPNAYPPAPLAQGNAMGLIALGCILASVLMMIPASAMLRPIQESVESIQDPIEKQNALTAEVMKHPGLLVLSGLSSCVLPLTALVLAIISLVRKRAPRWPAYTTLGLIAAGILMSCLGMMAQAMGGGV